MNLLNLFKNEDKGGFDAIKIGLASPEKFLVGLMVKLKSLRLSTIVPLNQSVMDFSVQRFSDL